MDELGPQDERRIGRYGVVGRLGAGGMGRVYLAVSPDGRLVALKQVHGSLARDSDFRSRFRREVEASRAVSGAYTAAVMDADPEADVPWLASVYVPGPGLDAAVRRCGPLPVRSVRVLAAGLAAALGEIHRAGLVHRDLKPSNVLLAEDGPRVIDFGIARAAETNTQVTQAGFVVGSPGYMSPEQAEGRPLTSAGDVFSLGAVLVLAASGDEPFGGGSTPQLLYRVVHQDPDLSRVPGELQELVRACVLKDPARRPTPEQVQELVGQIDPGESWLPIPVQTLITEQRDRSRELLAASRADGSRAAATTLQPVPPLTGAPTSATAPPGTPPPLTPPPGATPPGAAPAPGWTPRPQAPPTYAGPPHAPPTMAPGVGAPAPGWGPRPPGYTPQPGYPAYAASPAVRSSNSTGWVLAGVAVLVVAIVLGAIVIAVASRGGETAQGPSRFTGGQGGAPTGGAVSRQGMPEQCSVVPDGPLSALGTDAPDDIFTSEFDPDFIGSRVLDCNWESTADGIAVPGLRIRLAEHFDEEYRDPAAQRAREEFDSDRTIFLDGGGESDQVGWEQAYTRVAQDDECSLDVDLVAYSGADTLRLDYNYIHCGEAGPDTDQVLTQLREIARATAP